MHTSRVLVPTLAAIVLTSCAESPSNPTGGKPPNVTLNVRVDDRASATAIVAVSTITVDASQSTGVEPLVYAIDFGDGSPIASTANASHVYSTAGAYTVTARITDSTSKQTSQTANIRVETFEGAWFHSALNPEVNFVESRMLTVTEQHGTDLVGNYFSSSAQFDRPFRGTIDRDRRVHLALSDGTVTFDGVVPDQLRATGAVLSLDVTGGTANGERLPFEPIANGALSAAPTARLSIRNDSVGSAAAFLNVSPVQYDASASTGDGISCVIDFGDGTSATGCANIHLPAPPARTGPPNLYPFYRMTATVTATDRLGRVSQASAPVFVMALYNPPGYGTSWRRVLSVGPSPDVYNLEFDAQNGQVLSGSWTRNGPSPASGRFTGQLSGERAISLTLDNGAVYTGSLSASLLFPSSTTNDSMIFRMNLHVVSGPEAGSDIVFDYYEVF
jgi:PKD repeat protein